LASPSPKTNMPEDNFPPNKTNYHSCKEESNPPESHPHCGFIHSASNNFILASK
jgi:hypothetical protein